MIFDSKWIIYCKLPEESLFIYLLFLYAGGVVCVYDQIFCVCISGRIAGLEATTLQQTSTIKDLTTERDELKQRVLFLESLRQNLEKNSLTQVEEQEIRLRTLQKVPLIV